MPRRIIQYHAILFSFWRRIGFDEIAKRLYDRFVVEPIGFCHIKFSCGWNDKATVCDIVFSRFWHHLWLGTFGSPCPCSACLCLKMYFVLKYRNNVRILALCFTISCPCLSSSSGLWIKWRTFIITASIPMIPQAALYGNHFIRLLYLRPVN